MFTPQEIQEQTFSKAVFGGYDMQQVDAFLEPLTDDYIALYKVYKSCTPKNATLYLVLSIVVSVTQPFFVFFSRNKDEGMPPAQPPAGEEQAQIAAPEPAAQ